LRRYQKLNIQRHLTIIVSLKEDKKYIYEIELPDNTEMIHWNSYSASFFSV